MAKIIDYLTCMVGVTPYEHEGHNYDALNIIVAYRKGQGFCITWQPVKVKPMGYMTGPMPSSDPLVGGKGFVAKAANRNNVKVLEQIRANLLTGKEGIKFFFDQRKYDALKEFMGDVANYGFTYNVEKQLKETVDRFNAMSNVNKEKAQEADLSPMMKQFYDIKAKHPDALLLFRCGDFYEAYEQDAKTCSDILGITLTWRTPGKRHAPGDYSDAMAGFPYHALDMYLPKLVRHCRQPDAVLKRVAICDLPEPPKTTKKRGITELVTPKNNETMKLNISNQNESKNVPTAQVNNPKTAAIKVAEGSKPIPVEEYVEFEEVKEENKANKPNKADGANENKPQKNHEPQKTYYLVTYTTKKGGTAGYVMGFKTEQEAKSLADNACKTVGCTWRYNDKGEKVYALSLGSRYMEVAKTLCEALNKGDKAAVSKAIAQTHDIYADAVAAGKAEREEKKAAKKAEADKAKEKEVAKVKKDNGLYSMQEVADLMRRAMAGEDVPELKAVKEAMGLAA